jgi:hypothetical protein
MTRGQDGPWMVYRYSCSAAGVRPGRPVRIGFLTETLLGYKVEDAAEHLHALKRRRPAVSIVGIPPRCGTCRACVTVDGLAVAKIDPQPRPAVAATPRSALNRRHAGSPCIPPHSMIAERPDRCGTSAGPVEPKPTKHTT